MDESTAETLCATFHRTVRNQADRLGLIYREREITYSELDASVQCARQALSYLQPKPGERIALVADKTPEVITVLLAALQLRVTLVIINPLLKAAQIEHILTDSGATTLFCETTKAQYLLSECKAVWKLEHLILTSKSKAFSNAPASGQFNQSTVVPRTRIYQWKEFLELGQYTDRTRIIVGPSKQDLSMILYTSGSTGKPKGVMLSHSNLFHGAKSVSNYLANDYHDRILALMPLSFDYGLSQLTTAIFSGATLVLYDYLVPRGVVDIVRKQQVTGIPAVPHLWNQLLKVDWKDTNSVRYITSTGGRLQVPTLKGMADKLPYTSIYSMYGFTEAFRATYLPPTELSARPGSIGKAVPLANVLIVNSEGEELPPYQQGELIQSGPLVSLGYWNDSEGSARKIRRRKIDGPSAEPYAWSGDLAYKDEDGFIYFVSRKEDLVKLNGYRVSHAEVVASVSNCPLIYEVEVLCVPDDRFGNVVAAFVVLNGSATTMELTQWCKQELPPYMVPAHWIILDELPTTPNRKIDRQLLSTYINHGS